MRTAASKAKVPGRVAVLGFTGLMLGAPALAIQPTREAAALRMSDGSALPDHEVHPTLEIGESVRDEMPLDARRFLAEQPGPWEVRWDTRSDRPHLIQGAGVPLLPGRANRLSRADVGLDPASRLGVEDVERQVRAFMARYPELFRLAPADVRLDRSRSTSYGPGDRLWFVELQQFHQGVPVEGANVFFRINHGNLVQFGTDRIAEIGINAEPSIGSAEARQRGIEAMGMEPSELARVLNGGTLKVYPARGLGEQRNAPYQGLAGFGYEHLLVWESSFRRRGDPAAYTLAVDAHSGRLVGARDRSAHAAVDRGIDRIPNAEVLRHFAPTAVGCLATSGFTVLLAADEDNGNLADGTPNACRIWDAYAAHGIACGARPACWSGRATPTPTPMLEIPNTPTPVPNTPTPTPFPGGSVCASPDLAIPDNNSVGVATGISPSGSGVLTDLDVWLDIDHTWVGDVKVTLSHNGTVVALLDRPGVPASTYGCSGNDVTVTLADEAGTAVEGVCITGTTPAISGTHRPNGLLSTFDGHGLNRTWTLTVSDHNPSDTGRLVQWCLLPTTGGSPTKTPTPGLPRPTPTPVPGGCLSGTLTASGDFDYWPNSSGAARQAGTHVGSLTGPVGADFDLYLQKLSGASWQNVAQSIGPTSTESINHSNTAGTFRWRVVSWSGSGAYTLCTTNP